MPTQKKIDTVTELTDKVTRAKAMVFADFAGIKHKQLEDLRKTLKKVQGEFVVTKNRLLLRAIGATDQPLQEVLLQMLSQSTATLFAYADEVAPLKALLKFFKNVGLGKTKGGLLGASALSDTDVTRLATLPSRNILLGNLAGQLNAPIQGLHYALSWNMNRLMWALQNIKEKKC